MGHAEEVGVEVVEISGDVAAGVAAPRVGLGVEAAVQEVEGLVGVHNVAVAACVAAAGGRWRLLVAGATDGSCRRGRALAHAEALAAEFGTGHQEPPAATHAAPATLCTPTRPYTSCTAASTPSPTR